MYLYNVSSPQTQNHTGSGPIPCKMGTSGSRLFDSRGVIYSYLSGLLRYYRSGVKKDFCRYTKDENTDHKNN